MILRVDDGDGFDYDVEDMRRRRVDSHSVFVLSRVDQRGYDWTRGKDSSSLVGFGCWVLTLLLKAVRCGVQQATKLCWNERW